MAVLGGVAVGWVASVFGVPGGELRIPLLVYVFGAPLKIAGTLSTIAALPAVALAFAGYAIRDHVRSISGYMLIFVLSAASIVGATIDVALLPTVSDTVLRLLLGTVHVISAIRFDARPLDAPDPQPFGDTGLDPHTAASSCPVRFADAPGRMKVASATSSRAAL